MLGKLSAGEIAVGEVVIGEIVLGMLWWVNDLTPYFIHFSGKDTCFYTFYWE